MGVCCGKDLHIPQRRNRKPGPGALALHPQVSLPLRTTCAVHLPAACFQREGMLSIRVPQRHDSPTGDRIVTHVLHSVQHTWRIFSEPMVWLLR